MDVCFALLWNGFVPSWTEEAFEALVAHLALGGALSRRLVRLDRAGLLELCLGLLQVGHISRCTNRQHIEQFVCLISIDTTYIGRSVLAGTSRPGMVTNSIIPPTRPMVGSLLIGRLG